MKKRPVVGISFDGQRISAALVGHPGTQPEVKHFTEAALTLDPLTAEAALAGQEILSVLHAAGIRESRCVMCVPLKWLLSTQTEIPDLSGDDLQGFLDLHSEREFPFPPHDLLTAVSHYTVGQGHRGATIVCISAAHQTRLETLARAAGLRLVGITAGLTELAPPSQDGLRVDLQLQEHGVALQISAGGGVVALRSLAEVMHEEQGRKTVDAEAVFRQLRITMGKLPLPLQQAITSIDVYAAPAMLDTALAEIETVGRDRGIAIVRAESPCAKKIKGAPAQPCPSVCAAARRASEDAPVFELMPPRVTRLQRFAAHVSARSTLWLGAAAAAIVIVTGSAFWWQSHVLAGLSSDWEAIREDVERVDAIQTRIRAYRPWCDDSVKSLNVLHTLAESFPDRGTVWAQRVSVGLREGRYEVKYGATARGAENLLELHDRLRVDERTENLLTGQRRGNAPVVFSDSFFYKETPDAL